MAQLLIKVAGVDGQIELHKDRLIISRKGLFAIVAHGIKPLKEVPLSAISSVEFQEAGRFTTGSINFLYTGNSNNKSADTTVKFQRVSNEQFRVLKEEIFQLMNAK